MPKSGSSARRTPRAAGSCISIENVPFGSALSSRVSIRTVICGACAAAAIVFMTSPDRCDLGLVRWNACPSRPG
jgi:hypothetical protein